MRTIATTIAVMVVAATNAVEITSTVGSGGARATNAVAAYCNDGCIGGIGGVSSATATTARHGYIGLLTEVTALSVTGTPTIVNEMAATQLTGTARMDDDTVTALTGPEINWNLPAWPLQGISPTGVATAAVVYANTPATVNGTGSLLVLDTIPDNYGSYASDGLPDNWQVQYFGVNNPNAAPDKDITGTGQNNRFKYIAGLDPTNAASRFVVRIVSVTGQPVQKQLIFSPRWNDRSYTPEFRTDLMSGSYLPLTNTNTTDNATERTVTDLSATQTNKFYRVNISMP
jgi:hypothetical protein